jgi:CxxC motif-containing protein (DUF1111 family)
MRLGIALSSTFDLLGTTVAFHANAQAQRERFRVNGQVEVEGDGLGPIYNAQSCRECHRNVVTGGASQVAEHRTGRMQNGAFFESQGGSLIGSRTTCPDLEERVAFEDSIRTFRISTNTLGAGDVEAIAKTALLAIRLAQPASMRHAGQAAPVTQRFRALSAADQALLLEFLDSL